MIDTTQPPKFSEPTGAGDGKPGLCERQDKIERKFIYFAGAVVGGVFVFDIVINFVF